VLEPDATMIKNAQAANAGLLKNFQPLPGSANQDLMHVVVPGATKLTEALHHA
jgi:hypothetical protein